MPSPVECARHRDQPPRLNMTETIEGRKIRHRDQPPLNMTETIEGRKMARPLAMAERYARHVAGGMNRPRTPRPWTTSGALGGDPAQHFGDPNSCISPPL